MPTTLTTDAQPIALPFTNIHLTQAINNLPPTFGQLAAEGFFPAEGIAGTVVEIDIVDGVITALPVRDPEAPSTVGRKDSERAIYMKVPSVPHLMTLTANDIRGILTRAGVVSGSAGAGNPATLASETNRYLERMRRKFDITIELMRMAALKGIIIDGEGTELYNLFTVFGVTQDTVDFDLDTSTTDVVAKCTEVVQLIEDSISDETFVGIEGRCSRSFFNKLISHPNVQKFWLQTEQAQMLANVMAGQDAQYRPREFVFGNIRFKEYTVNVPMWGGSSQRIIAADTCHFYPAGTMDSHATYVAPPVDIRVLTGGAAATDDLVHVTQEVLKHGAGIELKGQMNALPIWRRPKLLVKGITG